MRASVCVCVGVNVFAYLQPIAHFDGHCLATGRVCVCGGARGRGLKKKNLVKRKPKTKLNFVQKISN